MKRMYSYLSSTLLSDLPIVKGVLMLSSLIKLNVEYGMYNDGMKYTSRMRIVDYRDSSKD